MVLIIAKVVNGDSLVASDLEQLVLALMEFQRFGSRDTWLSLKTRNSSDSCESRSP